MLSRVVSGARVSLGVAALAVALSLTLGTAVGLVAGYWGGAVDAVLMRVVDARARRFRGCSCCCCVLAVWERVPAGRADRR